MAFRHAKNLKESLFRARLSPERQGDLVKDCYRCGKARCQICQFMKEGMFVCHVSGSEYRITVFPLMAPGAVI